jgi:ABC-2 type transport system ATP-binding protein
MQAVELVGQIRGGQKSEVHQRARALITALSIEEWAEKPGETLSGGVRRLTAFCMAAVIPGQLVILDEPTNDIDPLRRRLLWKEVRKLADMGSAVLLVTHNVLEAERSVDRLAILDRGKVIGSGTPASLKGFENGFLRLELILEPFTSSPELPTFLTKVTQIGQRIIGRVEMHHVDQALDWAFRMRKMEVIEEFSIGPATLEDVYVSLVSQPDTSQMSKLEVKHVFSKEMVA